MIRAALLSFFALAACERTSSETGLEAEGASPAFRALSAENRPATLGAYALDLASGAEAGLYPDLPMPMQSVFKLPLGIVVMKAA